MKFYYLTKFIKMKKTYNIIFLALSFVLASVTLKAQIQGTVTDNNGCLLYTSPSPRDKRQSRMPSSA